MVENENIQELDVQRKKARLKSLGDKSAPQYFAQEIYDARKKLFGKENAEKWWDEHADYYKKMSRKVKAYETEHNTKILNMHEVRKKVFDGNKTSIVTENMENH